MANYYCCNILVSKNSNEGDPKTSLDDLNNEMLLEILCKLPCYRIALRCKAVSKRWYSLISDPLFITQAFLTHRKINKERKSSVAFLLNMSMWDNTDATAMVAPPCFQTTLWSPFLSLQFLPNQSAIIATFKDLILCHSVDCSRGYLDVYYICNPLTKQWIVLPPYELDKNGVIWAALTYLEGYGFRVVVAHSEPKASSSKDAFIMINLLIYISKTCQWRKIDVRLQLHPSNITYSIGQYLFIGVMCKGMVCIRYGAHFGAFDPFDVTNASHGTLTAIDLPLPARYVDMLLESDGKLVALEDTDIDLLVYYDGKLRHNLLAGKRIWKLDMRLNNDKLFPQWELISQFDDHIEVKGSILTPSGPCGRFGYESNFLGVVGVHPSKEHLVYLIKLGAYTQYPMILYNTKSKTLEPLITTIPPHNTIRTSNKLDIPCWPTPIPIP